jgi:hypothetical protein
MSRPATSRLKVNPPVGTMPVLQYCTPDQLLIDEGYQRTLLTGPSQTLIRRIAQFWDWGLCQPLMVARRQDGELYVVDGQHRLEAARLRGDIFQLPCVVAAYASAADEAASFVALNQQRRPLSALDLFKAALAAGDTEAVAVRQAITDAGLILSNHMNTVLMKPGAVCNIGGILRCYRRNGETVARAALAVLAQSYPNQVLRYAGTMFPGIVAVVADEVRLRSAPAEIIETIAAIVRGRTQEEWRRMFTASIGDAGGSMRDAAELVMRTAWRQRHFAAPAPSPRTVEAQCFPGEVWCEQCDRRVSGTTAAACTSPFCKAKARAA